MILGLGQRVTKQQGSEMLQIIYQTNYKFSKCSFTSVTKWKRREICWFTKLGKEFYQAMKDYRNIDWIKILLRLTLSGYTGFLTEAGNLIDELHNRGEVQEEQQNQNAFNKFHTEKTELPSHF